MKAKRERPRFYKFCDGPSRTKQSFQAECDINGIMAKHMATGLVDHVNQRQGRYEDLPSETDYHANLNSVMAAQEAFDSLPSKIRTRFKNDPGKFLGFVLDPSNKEEVQKMGLGAKPWEEALPAAEPVSEPAPEPPAE